MKGPLKTHRGKHYLAQKIIALMPPYTHFVEPYAGGLAVLLAKDTEGVSEVINDLNGNFTNFWQFLQDERLFARFQRRVQAIPFSEVEWHKAQQALDSAGEQVEKTVLFFVLCRQSMSGRCDDFSPLTRNRTRGGMNEQASSGSMNTVDSFALAKFLFPWQPTT